MEARVQIDPVADKTTRFDVFPVAIDRRWLFAAAASAICLRERLAW